MKKDSAGDRHPLRAADPAECVHQGQIADQRGDHAQRHQAPERVVDQEIEQLAEADQQRIARWMRLVMERIEPFDPLHEEDLVPLPETVRQGAETRRRHRPEAEEEGERQPPRAGGRRVGGGRHVQHEGRDYILPPWCPLGNAGFLLRPVPRPAYLRRPGAVRPRARCRALPHLPLPPRARRRATRGAPPRPRRRPRHLRPPRRRVGRRERRRRRAGRPQGPGHLPPSARPFRHRLRRRRRRRLRSGQPPRRPLPHPPRRLGPPAPPRLRPPGARRPPPAQGDRSRPPPESPLEPRPGKSRRPPRHDPRRGLHLRDPGSDAETAGRDRLRRLRGGGRGGGVSPRPCLVYGPAAGLSSPLRAPAAWAWGGEDAL